MNDKRGFVTIGLVISVMLISIIIISIFYKPIVNTTMDVKNSKSITPDYISNLSGQERVYSLLKENVSYKGNVSFEDLNREFKIKTIKEDYEDIELVNPNVFHINNETEITISLEAHPIDSNEPHSYDYTLTLNDEIVSEGGYNSGTVINIDKEFLYNADKNETNYGRYFLDINSNNCYVSTKVNFRRLKHREIKLSNESMDKIVYIDNNYIGGNLKNINIHFD